MKYQIILFISMLLASQASSQCSSSKTTYERIMMGVDVTGKEHLELFNQYATAEMNSLIAYLERKKAFTRCHKTTVTLTRFNSLARNRPILTKSYESIEGKFSNKQIKERVKKPFETSLYRALRQFEISDTYKEPRKTKLFEPLCFFIREKVRNRPYTLILFSDGLENNGKVSFSSENIADAEAILKKLEFDCKCSLPTKMNKVTLMLVSYRTQNNDDDVSKAQAFWKKVFRKRGARVVTSSALDFDLLFRN